MFGFPVPEEMVKEKGEPLRYWGARAIFRAGSFELLLDRTTLRLQPDDEKIIDSEENIALMFFARLNDTFLPWLRNAVKTLDISSDAVETKTQYGYTMMASPKSSFGYLYIGFWEHARPTRKYDLAAPDTEAKWSGKIAVPNIGERVKINFNQFGKGKVVSYFVEDGYLGVNVKLDKQPAWHKKQNGPTNYACVFGAEVDHV
jgi:hypothetical protein